MRVTVSSAGATRGASAHRTSPTSPTVEREPGEQRGNEKRGNDKTIIRNSQGHASAESQSVPKRPPPSPRAATLGPCSCGPRPCSPRSGPSGIRFSFLSNRSVNSTDARCPTPAATHRGSAVEELVSGRPFSWPSWVALACRCARAVLECRHLGEPHRQLNSLPLMSQKRSP